MKSIARLGSIFLLAALGACGARTETPPPKHPGWLIESRVVFVSTDRKSARAVPHEPLRLWVPYVLGDLYGAPNGGELEPVKLAADLEFKLDLDARHAALARSLIPTAFSQGWMKLDPAAARIARLSPFVMPAQGIVPLGVTEWMDSASGARLMLVYFDRPARLLGEIVHDGRSLRFDVQATEAGYVWVQQPDLSGVYRSVPRPANLVLAVMPNE